jgi:hypothetical protein
VFSGDPQAGAGHLLPSPTPPPPCYLVSRSTPPPPCHLLRSPMLPPCHLKHDASLHSFLTVHLLPSPSPCQHSTSYYDIRLLHYILHPNLVLHLESGECHTATRSYTLIHLSTTLWILIIQTELDTSLLTKGLHIIYQNIIFDDNVHLKGSMKRSISYIHPFVMSSSVHLGFSNKNGEVDAKFLT